jgi:hypothetical protein
VVNGVPGVSEGVGPQHCQPNIVECERETEFVRRDMELIRKALLAIEELPQTANQPLMLEGYDPQEVQYHVGLLYEQSCIRALKVGNFGGTLYYPTGLTAIGHEFADSIRDDSVWEKIKEMSLKETGSVTLESIRRATTDFVRSGGNTTLHVHDSQIGNISQVSGSQDVTVHQSSDATDLKDIFSAIDGVVEKVRQSNELSPETKDDLAIDAEQLKSELKRSTPNSNRIWEYLARFETVTAILQLGPMLPTLIDKIQHFLK